MAEDSGLRPDDRGAAMRRVLIDSFMRHPFTPFTIRLESGSALTVKSPEFISVEPGVLVATIYESEDDAEIFPVDRIVSIKRLA